jgi:hypothetical protein
MNYLTNVFNITYVKQYDANSNYYQHRNQLCQISARKLLMKNK